MAGTTDSLFTSQSEQVDIANSASPRILSANAIIPANTSKIVIGPFTIDSGVQLTIGSGGRFKIEDGGIVLPSVLFSNPGNPPSTASGSEVMMGLAQLITPLITGRLLITLSGSLLSVPPSRVTMNLRYGFGNAPTNGDASTGTIITQTPETNITSGATTMLFSMTAGITGLILNRQLWIDASLAIISGIAQIIDLTFVAIEI